MKNLKKVLAVMTAAATMCISASAFAATESEVTGDFKGIFEYDETTRTLTLADGYEDIVATLPGGVKAGTETTILVYLPDTDTPGVVEQDEIRYINQATAGMTEASMGLLADDNTYYEYVLKVGYTANADSKGEDGEPDGKFKAGDFLIAEGAIVVKEKTDTPAKKTLTFKWGDVTLDNSVGVADIMALLYFGVDDARSYPTGTPEYTVNQKYGEFTWGDITLDNSVGVADIMAILYYGVDDARSYPNDAPEYIVGTETTIEVE